MTPEISARAAARRIVEEVLAEHAARGRQPGAAVAPAGTGRSDALDAARASRPDTEAWRAARRIVDQTMQEHAGRAAAAATATAAATAAAAAAAPTAPTAPTEGPPPPPAAAERERHRVEPREREPVVQEPVPEPVVEEPAGPPPRPAAAREPVVATEPAVAPEPAPSAHVPVVPVVPVPSAVGAARPGGSSPDPAPDAPMSIAARIVAEVLASREESLAASPPSDLQPEPDPNPLPATDTLVLDGVGGDESDHVPLFHAATRASDLAPELEPFPEPEADLVAEPEPDHEFRDATGLERIGPDDDAPEMMGEPFDADRPFGAEQPTDVEQPADEEFGAWPEPVSPPRRTGRWLVTTILGAVALAWLLPLAIGALRDLVSLSS